MFQTKHVYDSEQIPLVEPPAGRRYTWKGGASTLQNVAQLEHRVAKRCSVLATAVSTFTPWLSESKAGGPYRQASVGPPKCYGNRARQKIRPWYQQQYF